MSVPAFSDIAKDSNDLINKDFYHTVASLLEVKLKSPNGVSITTKGTMAHDKTTCGSAEAKKSLVNGVTVTESWSTSNAINTKIEADGILADGLKAEMLNVFTPGAGFKSQKINFYFKQPMFHTRAFIDYAPSGNVSANIDGVIGHDGFLVGGEAGYDVQKASITRYSAAVGYSDGVMSTAIAATNNLNVFTASYYQKINNSTEAGLRAIYNVKTGRSVGLELASKYKIDPLSFAKAKINDQGIASLSYNTKVNPGFTFGIGASLDTQKLNEGGHKIGTSFTYES